MQNAGSVQISSIDIFATNSCNKDLIFCRALYSWWQKTTCNEPVTWNCNNTEVTWSCESLWRTIMHDLHRCPAGKIQYIAFHYLFYDCYGPWKNMLKGFLYSVFCGVCFELPCKMWTCFGNFEKWNMRKHFCFLPRKQGVIQRKYTMKIQGERFFMQLRLLSLWLIYYRFIEKKLKRAWRNSISYPLQSMVSPKCVVVLMIAIIQRVPLNVWKHVLN